MKTIKILTVILAVLLVGANTQASNMKSAENQNLLLLTKQGISNQINYPADAKQMMVEGNVSASIIIDGNGNIKVTGINGHPLLINSVKEQLEGLTLPISQNHGEMIMKFNFEIL